MLAPRPGLTAALGGPLGTPLGGVLLDRITRLPKEEAAAGHLVALPGAADSSLEPDAGADPVGSARSLWQASRILGLITAFIAAGGATLLGACLVCGWLPQPTFKPLALLLLGLGVLLCFATSAGITRAIMLLVPVPMRGFAIGVETRGPLVESGLPASCPHPGAQPQPRGRLRYSLASGRRWRLSLVLSTPGSGCTPSATCPRRS